MVLQAGMTGSVNKGSLAFLLGVYFPEFPEGKVAPLADRLMRTDYSLLELEFFARRMAKHAHIVESWIEQVPTRANLMEYSIEVFHDMDWEEVKSGPERRQLIKTLRSLVGLVRPTTNTEKELAMTPNAQLPQTAHQSTIFDDFELEVLQEQMEREFDQVMRKIAQREKELDSNQNRKVLFSSKIDEAMN